MAPDRECPLNIDIKNRGEKATLVRVSCDLTPTESFSKLLTRASSRLATGLGQIAANRFQTRCQGEESCLIAQICQGTKPANGWYHDKKT